MVLPQRVYKIMNTDIKKDKFDTLALLACTLSLLVSNVYIITTMYNELNTNIGFNLVSLNYVYTYLLMLFISGIKISTKPLAQFKDYYDSNEVLSTKDKALTSFMQLIVIWLLYAMYNLVSYFAF